MSRTGPKAVVLLSGGVDSSTTMALAKAEGYDVYALSFSYGQRHYRELASAKMVAEHLGARRHLVLGFDLREIGGSALTGDLDVPKSPEGSRPLSGDQEIPPTYVPARNTVFLSFALAWAEVLAACDIFIGANAVDYSGYPDCRPEYLAAFEKMANLGTKASVEGRVRFKIHAPLVFMTKGEIIGKGASLGLDYSLTWSCYDPQPSPDPLPTGTGGSTPVPPEELRYVPCGQCDSCLFRAAGFKEAGIADPLTSAETCRD